MTMYEKMYDYYDALFPLKNERLDLVHSFVKDKQHAILDIGCASGELALALAREGHTITAFDNEPGMISMAREKAKREALTIDFQVLDMMKLGDHFSANCFNAVLCFGNTLPHLTGMEQIEGLIISVFDVLKKEGIAMFQVVNFNRVLSQNIKELPVLDNKDFSFHREYVYDKKQHSITFNGTLMIKNTPGIKKQLISHKLFPITADELLTALEKAGFHDIALFGSDKMDAFDPVSSPACIAVAHK